ncbi:lytic transglycosylase domain-containing protein [Bradyrhizobium sp. STM 3557]|uniref:lytic transglycosylase domain-containing protein n=1 Tax=Bradyrhizobium sp. STM 3557 TaxID=578920 RepID=UPI0038906B0C
MAGEAPIYRQQLEVPDAPQGVIQPLSDQRSSNAGALGAIADAGEKIAAFTNKLYTAQQETAASTARASYLTGLSQAQDDAVNDPDYQNAPRKFEAKVNQLQGDALAQVDDPRTQAEMRLHLQVAGISAQGKVNAAALARQTNQSVASLDTATDGLVQRSSQAGSLYERKALRDSAFAGIDAAVAAGQIDATNGVARKQRFDHQLATFDVARDMAANPAQTVANLDDPAKYPGLMPFERESLKQQAVVAHDEQERLRGDDLAKRDPAVAAARYGVLSSRPLADQIYNRIIIPQESGGNPNVVSPAGAVGLGQLLPATARDQAKKLGMNDIAALDDATLAERLKDPALNTKLGSSFWADQLQHYGGNVFAAAAAYNAGQGSAAKPRADAWDAAARAQFGDHYSAAQLASVIPIKETRDYVLSVARRLGVDTDAPSLSFRGSYGVAAAVDQELRRQANAQRTQDNALISLTSADRDEIASAFKQGYAVNPQALQAVKQPLIDAASRGDIDAAVKLRQFEQAEATYPLVAEAYRHTPEEVGATVAAMQAAAAEGKLDPQALRRLDVLQGVNREMATARTGNPVGLAERQLGPQSVINLKPPQDARDPQFATLLTARAATATAANNQYGGAFKFFKPEELAAFKPWFDNLEPAQQAAAIGTIARATAGAARQAAFSEISDGKPSTVFAAGLFGQAPDIAQSIMEGAKAEDTYLPDKANRVAYETAKTTALPPALFVTSGRIDPNGPLAAMNDAIDARYAYLSAQANDNSKVLSSSRLKQAATDVTGGIVWHNGVPAIAPQRGMTQREFDGVIWGVTDQDLAAARTTGGTPITAEFLRGSARLRARSDGQYYVQLNQDDAKPAFAVTAAGAPFVLDLRNRRPVTLPMPDAFDNAAPLP